MATKTISLEIDAYEKLRSSKLPGESFSQVVRRAIFEKPHATGATLLEYYSAGGSMVSEEYLNEVEAADKNDRPPDDPWA